MTPQILLLGNAQDAGVPQAGCACPNCSAAQIDPNQKKFVVSLGIIDHEVKKFWMIDATPDFREQHHLLQSHVPDCEFGGILLTHAHMGHYTGLIHVGKEAMHTKQLSVFSSQRMGDFLRVNAPWNQLVEIKNIEIQEITPDQKFILTPNLTVTPISAPHRSEYTDTLGFIIHGVEKNLLFVPDINSWNEVDFDLQEFFADIDIALVDGSFFSGDELPGRDMSTFPHPTVTESMKIFKGFNTAFYFVHLNHSNPLWGEGAEREVVQKEGFEVAKQGQGWDI